MKKILTWLLTLMLLLGLAPVMASAGDIDTSEHVVLTWLVTGDIPTNKTDEVLAIFNEKLTEAINAEIQIRWIEWVDWQTQYNLALAMQNGDLDLIGTGTDWLDTWPNAERGALLPLSEEMLKTYAPMTWADVPPETWELCKYKGDIYFAPEDQFSSWVNHGFVYRGDWAKEAGLENGVNSWEEMGEYFQYIKDNMPDVIPWDAAGSGSSLGWQLIAGWQFSHSANLVLPGMPSALFYGNSKDDPYTVSRYYLEDDEVIRFAKTMKEWADAGYWREDVLNYSGDTTEEFRDGTTGAIQHHTSTWAGERVQVKMQQNFPDADVSFFWFGKEAQNLVTIDPGHGALSIAAQSKHPERALMAYDLIRNVPEFYNIMNYGIEGEQYDLDENGYRVRPEGYRDDALDGVSFNYWWGRSDAMGIRDGNRDWVAYDALIAEYECAVTFPYGQIVFDRDPISTELDNLSNVFNTYVPQIAFGKCDDPEAYVAEFRQALLNAGYETVLAELQAQLDAVYK
jgi:ABC-type glycerol-3-phosphate transport system substrate-binding protein